MKNAEQIFLRGFLVLLLMALGPVAHAADFGGFAEAAFHGPELKRKKAYGHHWNFKQGTVSRFLFTTTFKGQISRNIRLRPDDQIFYEIQYREGVIRSIKLKYGSRAWQPIAWQVTSALEPFYRKEPINSMRKSWDPRRRLAEVELSGWKGAVQKVIGQLAVWGTLADDTPILNVMDHVLITAQHGPRQQGLSFGGFTWDVSEVSQYNETRWNQESWTTQGHFTIRDLYNHQTRVTYRIRAYPISGRLQGIWVSINGAQFEEISQAVQDALGSRYRGSPPDDRELLEAASRLNRVREQTPVRMAEFLAAHIAMRLKPRGPRS